MSGQHWPGSKGGRPGRRGDREQRAAIHRTVGSHCSAGQHIPQSLTQLRVGVETEDCIRFGQASREFRAVTLSQTAHRNDLGAGVGRGKQSVDRVLLGCRDETARVDHDHVGGAVVGIHQLPTVLGEPAGQFLGVDLVAGAP